MKTIGVILAAGIVGAFAACPNFCSQQGSCGADDKCHCWNGYDGYDCSKRACPFVEGWAVDHVEGAHRYAECAGRGLCDRSSGLCDCFPGFEGRGCERAACPNACSEHGQCKLIADLKNIVNVGASANALGSSLDWDEKALTACVCDGGYTGSDCSQRICPYGDDPMTLCETAEAEQVQKVAVKWYGELLDDDAANGFISAVLENDDMAFRFESYAGEVLYTGSVGGFFAGNNPVSNDAGKVALATALEALPNFRVRDVTVTHTANAYADGDASAATVAYEITFHHLSGVQNSFGRQNLLQCPHTRTYAETSSLTDTTFGCGAEGCQPRFLQPRLVTILSTELVANVISAATANVFDYKATQTANAWTLGVAATNTYAYFSADSVLTCPREVYCARSQTSFQGAIHLQLVVSGSDTLVYVKGVGTTGNTGTQNLFSDDNIAANGVNLDGSSAAVLNTYTFMGKLADFPAFDGSSKRVDVSQIMPDTALIVKTSQPANSMQVILAFTTPECVAASDVTVSSSKALENVDSENIECAGRGECDRSNGLCQCFEGYTGNNCGSQTILV